MHEINVDSDHEFRESSGRIHPRTIVLLLNLRVCLGMGLCLGLRVCLRLRVQLRLRWARGYQVVRRLNRHMTRD